MNVIARGLGLWIGTVFLHLVRVPQVESAMSQNKRVVVLRMSGGTVGRRFTVPTTGRTCTERIDPQSKPG